MLVTVLYSTGNKLYNRFFSILRDIEVLVSSARYLNQETLSLNLLKSLLSFWAHLIRIYIQSQLFISNIFIIQSWQHKKEIIFSPNSRSLYEYIQLSTSNKTRIFKVIYTYVCMWVRTDRTVNIMCRIGKSNF